MATKVTDLTELTSTPANGDYIHIIDVDDTTGGAAGTSKKVTISRLPSGGGGSATIAVRNDTGSTITAGTAVYITGVVSGTPTIAAADNSSASTMNAAGIVQSDIANNTNGDMVTSGEVQALDTSAFTAGETLYVGTSGALTATRPTGTALVQNIGTCLKVSASTGSIIVQGAGRSNDVPNLPNGQVFVGNASGVAVARDFDVEDLGNAITGGASQGQNLAYNTSGNWTLDSRTNLLYANLKQGSSTTINDGAGTTSKMELTSTTAELKTGTTGLRITETSPGDIEFDVATDATGSTTFTALHLDGTTTANIADLIVKVGCYFKFEDGLYTQWIRPSSGTTGNTTLILPDKTGTLVVESEVPTLVTDLTDVTSAGSGQIITSAERSKLSGIAAGAEVNAVDSVNTQTGAVVLDADDISDASTTNKFTTAADISKLAGIATAATANQTDAYLLDRANHTGTQLAATISDFATQVNARIGLASITDLSDTMSSLVASNILRVNAAGTAVGLEDKRIPYVDSEVQADQNRIFEKSVTTTSNRIVDFMNDTLAARDNANAKNLLGFYDGTDNIVLEGMVDAGNSIAGASAGAPLWLGASGAFSATAPTTATEYSRVVGHYIGAGQGSEIFVYFNPSRDWVQID